jgi:hypothetical protein
MASETDRVTPSKGRLFYRPITNGDIAFDHIVGMICESAKSALDRIRLTARKRRRRNALRIAVSHQQEELRAEDQVGQQ